MYRQIEIFIPKIMNDISEIIKYFRNCPDKFDSNFTIKIDLNEAICKIFKIPVNSLFDRSRKREIINARRLYMYILNKEMKWGPSLTGRYTGWDHASVIYSSKKCEDLMDTEKDYKAKVNLILSELNHERIRIPNCNHFKLNN